MLNATYIITLWGQSANDIGAILFTAVGGVVTGVIALLGLGFGMRSIQEYITGNGIERKIKRDNQRAIAQMTNSELLDLGDRTGTIDSMA